MPTVLITGAASGIGLASALLFLERGWHCLLVDKDIQTLPSILEKQTPTHQHRAKLIQADLFHHDSIPHIASQAQPLDALINNAGITNSSGLTLDNSTPEQLEKLMEINTFAQGRIIQTLTPFFNSAARIVNVASGAGLRALPFRNAYSASKAGVIALTQYLAQHSSLYTVTTLAPGFVKTQIIQNLLKTQQLQENAAVAKIPLGRLAETKELAEAVYFLASPAAALLHGEVLAVDGGSSIYGGSFSYSTQSFQSEDKYINKIKVNKDSDTYIVKAINTYIDPTSPNRLDFSLLKSKKNKLLTDLHQKIINYRKEKKDISAITFILPDIHHTNNEWASHVELESARMLIRTYACEIAEEGIRINAIHWHHSLSIEQLLPLLLFITSSKCQYITGQIITTHEHHLYT